MAELPDSKYVFTGVDFKVVSREIGELCLIKDNFDRDIPLPIFGKLEGILDRIEDDSWSDLEEKLKRLETREYNAEHKLYWILVFSTLFVIVLGDEGQEDAFNSFVSKLSGSANATEFIDKHVYMLGGANQTLDEMINMKMMFMNMATKIDERKLQEFLDILLKGMEAFDSVLREGELIEVVDALLLKGRERLGLGDTADNPRSLFDREMLVADAMINRLEAAVESIAQQCLLSFGAFFREWDNEVQGVIQKNY